MRKATILVFALILGVLSVHAQKVFLGPTLLFKAGVNAGNIPEGQKTAMNFNGAPDISANVLWLFNKGANLGIIGDFSYSTLSYRMRPESEAAANDDNTSVIKPTYFTISPGFYLSSFTIGVGLNFPMGINISSVSGNEISTNSDNLQSPLIDVRIGGMVPVYEHETGRLSVLVHFAYAVSGLGKPIAGVDDTYNPKVMSGGLGLAYHFNLTNMTE